MGLFDVIDDITSKQVIKTETGDNRIFGVMIGIVVKNYDEKMPGRVCVSIPVRDANANTLKWAKMATNSNGKKWGTYFLPEIGDQVVLAFEEGNIEKPYIIGCVAMENSKVVSENADKDNQFKTITSKNGSHIKFVDNKDGDGEKDQIEIQTAQGLHTVLLDNEKNEIAITSKDKKNAMVLRTEKGELDINTTQKLTIKVGDSISLKLDGESGAVTLKCNKINVSSSDNINLSTDGNFKLEGSTVKASASNSFLAESDGTAKLSGAIVSIG